MFVKQICLKDSLPVNRFLRHSVFGYSLNLLRIKISDSKLMFVKLSGFNANLSKKPWLSLNMLV